MNKEITDLFFAKTGIAMGGLAFLLSYLPSFADFDVALTLATRLVTFATAIGGAILVWFNVINNWKKRNEKDPSQSSK